MNVDVLHFFSRYMWTEQLSCPSCLFLVDKKLPRAFSSLRIGFSAWIRIQQNYDFYLLSYHPIGKPIAYTVIPVIFVLKVAEFWVTWLKSAERRVQNCFCKPRAVDSEKLLVHQHQTSINRSEFSGGQADMFRAGTFSLWGEAEGMSNVQKTRLQAGLKSILPINNTQAGSSQQCMMEPWSSHKLKHEHFGLNIMGRKTSRTIKQWNRLPRKALCSPCLLVFMTRMNKYMSNLIWSCSCLSRRLDKRSPTVPFNLNYLKILWWQVHKSKLIVFCKKEKRYIAT